MGNKLVIGTRSSDLALWQAYFIKGELEKIHKDITVEIKHVSTKGDKILDVALSKIGDKGLFTKELEVALLNGEVDIAVHSLKDLQTAIPEGLSLTAITKRHDVEDVLIAREKNITIDDLPENAVVGTGSLRRKSQLLHLRPDITTEELRGNVPTRIQKFKDSKWDAIILARAGVERLKLHDEISSVIPIETMLPAVGQGALGIEIKEDNKLAAELLAPLNDDNTNRAVMAERAFLRRLEGGCQVPIAAFSEVRTNGLYFEGFVGSVDGSVTFRKKVRSSKNYAEQTGIEIAEDMLEAGAGDVLKEIYGDSK